MEGRWAARGQEGERTGSGGERGTKKKNPDDVIRKADGRQRRLDLEVIESCRELF